MFEGYHAFHKKDHKAVWVLYREIGSDNSFHKLFRLGRERVKIFAVDETGVILQTFLFIACEPFEDRILGLLVAWTRSSISTDMFLKDLMRKFGHHPVRTNGAAWYKLA